MSLSPQVVQPGRGATPSATAAAADTIRTANDGQVVLDRVPEVPARIAGRMSRYLNTRGAAFQDWTGDGRGVFIVTRFGDVQQLHRVDAPGGARHQLTFFDEPLAAAERRPGTPELVFSMDSGGGEFYQLYLLNPATGRDRLLTDGRSRNLFGRWSADGRRFAFTSTRRDGRSNDVWIAELDRSAGAPGEVALAETISPDATRLVLEAPDGALWSGVDWDATGSHLLVVQYVSVVDSRLHLLDPDRGELRLVAGGDERPGNYTGVSPRFTADGRGVFLATDALSEFLQLARLDLESGKLRVLTSEIPWDVEGFALSDDGRRAAFVVNEGGLSRLYLLDPATLRHERVDSVPVGVLSDPKFSPDGSRLAFTLNGPTTPSDVFTLELEALPGSASEVLGEGTPDPLRARELTRWTFSEVGGLDTGTFVTPELVEYDSFDGRRIPAFVYRPAGPGPHPVVVGIHGGPESQERPVFNPAYQFWVVEQGLAVVTPNVRGSSGYGKSYVKLDDGRLREDSVRDVGALLDWIATRPDLDASRIAVAGGSYGGYMVLASLVHYGDRLRAGVDVVGISNFVTFLENTQEYRRDLRREEYGDERDPEMRAFLDSISPNRNAGRIGVPLLVAQGANDPRVPVTEAEQIVAAVRAAGNEVWYVNALNEGHGFQKKENRDLYAQIVATFFERHLVAGARPLGAYPEANDSTPAATALHRPSSSSDTSRLAPPAPAPGPPSRTPPLPP
ncbi:MAG: prolyl oligopeptidase family serine peptidase [Gemmatimonadota bacterium]